MLSVFYGIINALYDLINTIRILFRGEEGKERCKLWARTLSEQIYKKRGHWVCSSSSRFIHKATISGFACSYHGLELFPFFPVIYLYLSNLHNFPVFRACNNLHESLQAMVFSVPCCPMLQDSSHATSQGTSHYWCLFLSDPSGKKQRSCFKLQAFQKPKIQFNQDLKCHNVWFKKK